MSFFTSLKFVRPRKPPVVTGAALSTFLQQFFALEVVEPKRSLQQRALQLRFGAAIDQDDRPPHFEEPEGDSGIVSAVRSITWDVDESPASVEELLAILKKELRPIYRAYVDLGPLPRWLFEYLAGPNGPIPEGHLALDSWSLEIGPIKSHGLSSEVLWQAG